jgi:hypothetical protein
MFMVLLEGVFPLYEERRLIITYASCIPVIIPKRRLTISGMNINPCRHYSTSPVDRENDGRRCAHEHGAMPRRQGQSPIRRAAVDRRT